MIKIADMRSPCAITNGLEILGDRWTLVIIRDLMFTNRSEFGHFLASGEGISTNILADRLQRLQYHGLITKEPHPEHGKKFRYQLTDQGLKLAPTLIEFSLWAVQNIDKTMVPPPLIDMMKTDPKALVKRVKNRQPIVNVDL